MKISLRSKYILYVSICYVGLIVLVAITVLVYTNWLFFTIDIAWLILWKIMARSVCCPKCGMPIEGYQLFDPKGPYYVIGKICAQCGFDLSVVSKNKYTNKKK